MSEATNNQNTKKLVTASARFLHLSPRKMRLVTNLVKGMNANNALAELLHTNKKGAPMVFKLLKSAIANAKNNFSLDTEHLFIKSITCNMAVTMKRYFPRARGSAFPIKRKTCSVNIVLEERKTGKATKSRLALFSGKKHEGNKDQEKATNEIPPHELGKKSEVFKTEQQMKLNKAQNKRRLFNRKSGE